MATETDQPAAGVTSSEEIDATMTGIRRMLILGGLFAGVGYLLLIGALVLEFTQFHPLIQDFFAQHTEWSLAGGGPDRAGATAVNSQLATIHQYPSTLLWLKLGGIGHILVGIFIVLAAIVRALSLMPTRLAAQLNG